MPPHKMAVIVEGQGDAAAAKVLLLRLLDQEFQRTDWLIQAKGVGGSGELTKQGGIERFVQLCLRQEPDCRGILILLDGDAARKLPSSQQPRDPCSPWFARYLADRVRRMQPLVPVPVTVVVARWEYEVWLIAGIETTAQHLPGSPQSHPPCPPNVEELPNPKKWLDNCVPRGQKYLETRDQAQLTATMDFGLVAQRCRSFRRLKNALGQILSNQALGQAVVTP
ncbi:MAG: DUF4276 family protein [Chloroflexota bacterium]|nr:DUF4276 family protein [Chloroflexota bacterium]